MLRTWSPSLPSSRAAGYFCSVKNHSEHFGTARLVQEGISSNCLLHSFVFGFEDPKIWEVAGKDPGSGSVVGEGGWGPRKNFTGLR